MKKFVFLLFLAATLLFSLCACSSACEHQFSQWELIMDPTCRKVGLEMRICGLCQTAENRFVEKLPHTEVLCPASAPTCAQTGLTEGKYCAVCGEIVAEQEIIPINPNAHYFPGNQGTCSYCGLKLFSDNLRFAMNTYGYYSITYIGDCDDGEVILPTHWNDVAVTVIDKHACTWNDSLIKITIPETVRTIEVGAFIGCENLTTIVISDSVTSIGEKAFEHCTSLTDVYYTGSAEEWANISIGASNSALLKANIHYHYVPEN